MSDWRDTPGPARVRVEPEHEAVLLAYDHVIDELGSVVSGLLHSFPPEELDEAQRELRSHIDRFATDSLLPAVVKGMVRMRYAEPEFSADFDQAFARAAARARKMLEKAMDA